MELRQAATHVGDRDDTASVTRRVQQGLAMCVPAPQAAGGQRSAGSLELSRGVGRVLPDRTRRPARPGIVWAARCEVANQPPPSCGRREGDKVGIHA